MVWTVIGTGTVVDDVLELELVLEEGFVLEDVIGLDLDVEPDCIEEEIMDELLILTVGILTLIFNGLLLLELDDEERELVLLIGDEELATDALLLKLEDVTFSFSYTKILELPPHCSREFPVQGIAQPP